MRKDKALGRLQKILDEVDGLKQFSSSSSPQFERWWRNAELAIEKVFGSDSSHIKRFKNARDARVNVGVLLFVNFGPVGPDGVKKDYIQDLEFYAAMIQSMIDEVGEYWEDGKEVLSSSSSSSSLGNEQIMTGDLKKKKVFLSHKSDDKELVIDFKETLKILGYDPWLDEDAMSAGTRLEQGLLEGMQDSCGVVFFVTSSFKDEGFLSTEIDYAIQEERKKGNKFKIVTLQFVDADGNRSEIPGLLKRYVWKKPKTRLEALREIVHALPVASLGIGWRGEIGGVVVRSEGDEGVLVGSERRLVVARLSEEAKTLLKTAVDNKKQIGYFSYGSGGVGELITMGGEEFLSSDKETLETMAKWRGGLKDLEREGYVKKEVEGEGDQGLYTVTREGYEAAEYLEMEIQAIPEKVRVSVVGKEGDEVRSSFIT